MWAPRIDGCGPLSSGSPWATPMTRDWKSGQTSDATAARNSRPLNEQILWPTHTVRGSNAKKNLSPTSGDGLNTAVKAAMLYPTPTALSYGSNQGGRSAGAGPVRPALASLHKAPGQTLSAAWVECLMGFPPGFTAIASPPAAEKPPTTTSRPARSKPARTRRTAGG